MITATQEQKNPGFGTFRIENTNLEVRKSLIDDIKPIIKLFNEEVFASGIEQILRTNPEKVLAYLSGLSNMPWRKEENGRQLYSSKRVGYITNLIEDVGQPEAYIDPVDSVEVNRWIQAGLSIVTDINVLDGMPIKVLGGHMCGRVLEAELGPNGKGYIEITAGLVNPQYRGALRIQDRERFALLNEISIRYSDQTKIVSVSKQEKVGIALAVSGFDEADSETKKILKPVIWYEPWTVRMASVATWKRIREQNKLNAPDDYIRFVTIAEAEEKARTDAVKALRR